MLLRNSGKYGRVCNSGAFGLICSSALASGSFGIVEASRCATLPPGNNLPGGSDSHVLAFSLASSVAGFAAIVAVSPAKVDRKEWYLKWWPRAPGLGAVWLGIRRRIAAGCGLGALRKT